MPGQIDGEEKELLMFGWTMRGTLGHAQSQQGVHDWKGEEKSSEPCTKSGPLALQGLSRIWWLLA